MMSPDEAAGPITQEHRDNASNAASSVLDAVKNKHAGLVVSSKGHYSVVSAMRTLNIVGSCQEAVADACFNLADKKGEGFLRVVEDQAGNYWLYFEYVQSN